MFRKTDTNPQLDLFAAPGNILPKRAQKKYTNEKAWHNQFFKLVTSQIDEESFRPLFEENKMGAPNASIRILVAMSILKEGFGCSDEEEVRRSELRRKIESLPIEEQNKRNNIEAAMFQYSFHTRNGKTRYRGLFRHRLQAFHRCMWMNPRRLVLFQTTIYQRPLPGPVSSLTGKV